MQRRDFLKGAVVGAGAAAVGSAIGSAIGANPASAFVNLAAGLRPDLVPSKTPVKTIVLAMMENRSVDHYLGWYGAENPDFDGTQKGRFLDKRTGTATSGQLVRTEDWGAGGRGNFHGRGFDDPGHGFKNGRVQWNHGKMNGFLHPGSGSDEFSLATYGPDDVPAWASLVRTFQTYDRYHCALLGPTGPNRWYALSGQTQGEVSNTLPPQRVGERPDWALGYNWPTIFDLLNAAGVSWAMYFSNIPNSAYWGYRYLPNTRHISEYYAAAAAGLLPQVVFLEPWFIAPDGIANDDHPHADLRYGQEFLSDITGAFLDSPQFAEGAMFVTYDEWGGFWDHVAPPAIADSQDDPTWSQYVSRPEHAATFGSGRNVGFGRLGLRVPMVTLSPWTVGTPVDHRLYNHCSVTRFIGENWGLPVAQLNPKRIAASRSMEHTFDFSRPKVLEVDHVRYDAPLEIRTEAYLEQLPAFDATKASDLYRLAETGFLDRLPLNLDHRFEDSFRYRRG